MALTTFVGQNIGAKEYDRIKKGTVFGLAAGMLVAEFMGAIIFIFAPWLIGIFNDDPQVIYYGQLQARNVVPAYFLLAFSHGMAGIMRGAGLSKVPMFIMTFCWCVLRLIWIAFALPMWRDIRMVFWAYPITWTVGAIVLLWYFLKVDWMHKYE
jgi:Na+-driven multidrug efflux pump